jgi:ribosomal protein L29
MSELITQIQHFEYVKRRIQDDIDDHDKKRNTLLRENKTDENDRMIAWWTGHIEASKEEMRTAKKCLAQALTVVLGNIILSM